MARPLTGGRTSISPTEREMATTMFELVAVLFNAGRLTEDEILTAATGNMELASDIIFPPRALHEGSETNDEWIDVERARAEHLKDITPQAVAEIAAEFGVRLPLKDTYVKKWADKAPKVS